MGGKTDDVTLAVIKVPLSTAEEEAAAAEGGAGTAAGGVAGVTPQREEELVLGGAGRPVFGRERRRKMREYAEVRWVLAGVCWGERRS